MKNSLIRCIFCMLLSCLFISLKAQDCGTDAVHTHLMKTNPQYKERFNSIQKQIKSNLTNKKLNKTALQDSTIITIPVVFHVFHLGEPVGTGVNISDEQIIGAVQGLNERYSNLNGSGLDMGIRFCLAVRDPDGCPTTGINRVDASGIPKYAANGVAYGDTIGAQDYLLKNLSKWPVLDYYNIWVVNKINGGWAGYAYYPWGAEYDGAIMHHVYTAYQYPTLAHELGHALFLAHTFSGDDGNKNCPLDVDCTQDGDWICDTPPHKQGDCGGINPCTDLGVWDNSRYNYMSYCFPSGSLFRFTPDQKDRVAATMQEYPRAGLLNSLACVPSTFNTIVEMDNVSCNGGCDGFASVTPLCDNDYKYLWSNGDTTQTITNICAGTYYVTVTNPDQLSASFNFEVTEPNEISISTEVTNAICKGDSDGAISATVTGGTPIYKYSWSNGQFGKNATALSEGIYQLTITDIKGCTQLDTIELTASSLPIVDAGDDINITEGFSTVLGGLPSSNGNGPFTYLWFPATALDSTNTANPLAKPVEDITYYLVVTDANGCSAMDSVKVLVTPSSTEETSKLIPVISVFPNPGKDVSEVNVVNLENGSYTVKLTNIAGQIVYEKYMQVFTHNLKHKINLDEIASGTYFLSIESPKGKLVTKLVKK